MPEQESLIKIPNYEDNLIFYKIMNYPIPSDSKSFLFEKKLDGERLTEKTDEMGFSWYKQNPYMQEYRTYIDKYGRLYRSLPFVQSIYLCNSLSFNALKEDSDIDLFIVTKKNKLRRARVFSVIFFLFLGIKRSLNKKSKKFCLSFYITEDAQNLYNITLPKTDIYFAYWLAHLVPLYQEKKTNIYEKNKRLNMVLPNFPNHHIINIGTKLYKGDTNIKKTIEFIFGGFFGVLVENIIKLARLPIILHKTKKHGDDGRGIIISSKMLKFHLDIRKKVRVNYNLRKKGIHKTIYGIQNK